MAKFCVQYLFDYINLRRKYLMISLQSADVTMKPTVSVSSGENSGLDVTVSDQQVPRRASKRLAGIKAGPLPELKTIRARRDVVKQSEEDETVVNAERSTDNLPFPALESTENKMENHATEKDCVKVLKNGDNVDAKLDYANEFPLKEILTDPCIAFAIQTLTGETFETAKDTHSDSKSKQHCENSAYTEEHGKKINVVHDDSDGCKVLSSSEKFAQVDKVGIVKCELMQK
jgi:hypothetical protein